MPDKEKSLSQIARRVQQILNRDDEIYPPMPIGDWLFSDYHGPEDLVNRFESDLTPLPPRKSIQQLLMEQGLIESPKDERPMFRFKKENYRL